MELKLLNLNLTDVMNTWTKQMGHPVITINRINSTSIQIRQKQFLLDPTYPPSVVSPYQ
jgi:aminopeptidase N